MAATTAAITASDIVSTSADRWLVKTAAKWRKVGVLLSGVESDPDSQVRITAFRRGFADLGWKEGENVQIEYRWSAGKSDLIRRYAEELVALKPDVILANSTPVIATLKSLTTSIPIVSRSWSMRGIPSVVTLRTCVSPR